MQKIPALGAEWQIVARQFVWYRFFQILSVKVLESIALFVMSAYRYVMKFQELISYHVYLEELWNAMKGLFLKHFCILGFAQKETISLIHDTLCAWCYIEPEIRRYFWEFKSKKYFKCKFFSLSILPTHLHNIVSFLPLHSNKHAIVSKNVYNFQKWNVHFLYLYVKVRFI